MYREVYFADMDLDLHPRTTAIIITATMLTVGLIFLSYEYIKRWSHADAESTCPSGTERVGEDCMTLKEACEIRGDGYRFIERIQECVSA